MMQSKIDDGKTNTAVCHYLENNDNLDEPANSQPKEGNPNEPSETQPKEGNPDEPVKSLPKEGKDEEPGNSQPREGTPGEPGQFKEKPDSEKTMQSSDRHDQPEGGLQVQNKENPDGKQKKRKFILKQKNNASNVNASQNKKTPAKGKLGQQKKAKFAKPEGSVQEKNLELVVKVADQLPKEETDMIEGTGQRTAMNENNGDLSKGDKNKKRRQRVKKGKGISGSKIENLKQQTGEASGSMNSGKMTGKLRLQDKGSGHDKAKDKLGGLIFMCSSKTKPDCFRYSVMGVTVNKKDLVLSIKPGLKLFLYDFDLKLLYGVYRATSAGGMKLEPAAFGGAFPVQVKFEVFKDCYPLPESVFQKAIKENYNEKRKFKTELTFEQVKKLMTLFQTVGISSNSHTRTSPAKINETKVHGGHREYRTHSNRARSNRDDYTHVGRGRESRKEESPHKPFQSEREYRTYGLPGRRQSRSPPRLTSSVAAPRYDLEREVSVRYPGSLYGHDPLLVGRSDTRPYSLEGRREITSSIYHEPAVFDGRRYLTDSNHQQYIRPSYDLPHDSYSSSMVRRDEVLNAGPYYSLDGRRVVFLPEPDSSQRREPEAAFYQEPSRHDPLYASVSSRYSFAGPSSTYR